MSGMQTARVPRDSAMDNAADWGYTAALPKIDRRDQIVPPPPVPCPCSDVRLRAGFDLPPDPIGCFEQAQLGKCSCAPCSINHPAHFMRLPPHVRRRVCATAASQNGAAFRDPAMMLTVDEVPEGYCQISCGRCECCATVLEVLREEGFAVLADAVVAVGLDSILSNPGFETTMLAPSDDAMRRAAADLGACGACCVVLLLPAILHIPPCWGQKHSCITQCMRCARISCKRANSEAMPLAGHSASPQDWNTAQRLYWRQVLLQHLVPPHPIYKALWSSAFLLDGKQLDTELHVKCDLVAAASAPG